MKEYITKIWKDPVGSSLIASFIIFIIKLIFFSGENENIDLEEQSHAISLDIWLIGAIVVGVLLFIRLLLAWNRDRIHNQSLSDDDIHIMLSKWWPSKSMFDGNVFVEYEKVDRKLKLPKGSTKRHISKVAMSKLYKPVAVGDRQAEFQVDFKRVMPKNV
ncbi:hypothetical protein ONY95_004569 [Vibrio parahaemolyticus]|nr:hypothetical protein [Vibrio parahaemolyticus]